MPELALFSSAFLAATILPFSSELAFVVSITNGMSTTNALLFASLGNILAIVVNYWIGYWLQEKTKVKLNRSKVGLKSLDYGHKYGYYALALSWLPVIGDPLTLVAGVVRLEFVWFVLIVGTLRIFRYLFLVQIIN